MAAHEITSSVVTTQPGVYQSHIKYATWNSNLYSCCDDMGICCCGFWCPFCLSCKTSADFGENLCMPLVDRLAGVPAAALAMRTAMRERYHIQGSMFDDCCIVTFFPYFAWCQMARELKYRKGLQTQTTTQTTTVVQMQHPMNVVQVQQPINVAQVQHPQ